TITLSVQNGPGFPTDCITLDFTDFHGFDGVHHQVFAWVTNRTMILSFPAPTAAGFYAASYWQNCAVRLALSPTVTVSPPPPSLAINGSTIPITVAGGTTVTLNVQNGPGYPWDCVSLEMIDGSWWNYAYVNGPT